MKEENQSSGRHLQTAASAANAVRGAVKTGKAAANMAKGAAAGPYGAAAAGLWASRGILVKLIAAAVFLLLLPILFITMLPSLIFGGMGLDSAPDHVLNDNTVLMANLAAAETTIEEGLREKHRLILEKIKQEGDALGSNCDYTITDDFADSIVYESTLLISQFCASQADYKEVRLEKLKQLIDGAAGLFSYHVNITSEEVTDPDTNTTETIYHYAYYVDYAGDVYFADYIFQLTDEQKVLADDYASNLNVFLYDTAFKVDINPNLRPGETGNAAVDLALTKLNTPYSQARRNQDGYFDCSSFCYWVYSQLGVTLSYEGSNTAAAQGRFITENNLAVSYENLAPGDLVFYSFETNNRYLNISHMGIYCGDGFLVDASSGRGKVVYRPIYSINHIVLCGRPYTAAD